MANRAKQPAPNGSQVQFPPEADSDFDVVSVDDIGAWRDKLEARFGLGQCNLRVLEEVERSH